MCVYWNLIEILHGCELHIWRRNPYLTRVYQVIVYFQASTHNHPHTTILKILFVESLDVILAASEDTNICKFYHLDGKVLLKFCHKWISDRMSVFCPSNINIVCYNYINQCNLTHMNFIKAKDIYYLAKPRNIIMYVCVKENIEPV